MLAACGVMLEEGDGFGVGVEVTGLSGTVVFQLNSGSNLTLSSDGTLYFSNPLADGATYNVTVSTQPSGQTCTVTSGAGTISGARVTLTVTCAAGSSFTVGGTVSGLSGTVVLQNNSADNLSITASSFTFATSVADGAAYAVTVLTQPSGQTCTITSGSGTISGANITNVTVTCSADTFSVGGTISGLSGTVVLQNNSGDDLSRTTNAAFTFTTKIADGATYSVTVLTQPSGQTCTITSGSGTISGANITNVTVTCTSKIIWVTANTTDGSIGDGGIAGADTMCADTDDANHPNNGSTYKALITDQTNRIACTTDNCGGVGEHTDWVLTASTEYKRADNTVIGTTNNVGIFIFNLDAAFTGTAGNAWTGLSQTWRTSGDRCINWTSAAAEEVGKQGDPTAITAIAISSTELGCDTTAKLICVEQ